MDTKTNIEVAELIFKIVVGVVAAGWAFYLLRLIHRPLAQAGLLKSKMELEEHQQRTEKHQREKSLLAGLTVHLEATAHRISGSTEFVIIATVDLTNRTGSHVFRLDWREDPLHVRMTTFDAQGNPKYKGGTAFFVRRTTDPNSKAMSLRIRPGATESLSFAVGVSAPGIYLVTFRIPLDPEYLKDVKILGMDLPSAWTRCAHVIVGDTPVPASSAAV